MHIFQFFKAELEVKIRFDIGDNLTKILRIKEEERTRKLSRGQMRIIGWAVAKLAREIIEDTKQIVLPHNTEA